MENQIKIPQTNPKNRFLVFTNEQGEIIGRIYYENDKWYFDGNIEQSAEKFIEFLNIEFSNRIKDKVYGKSN
jgi:hypothetical protein